MTLRHKCACTSMPTIAINVFGKYLNSSPCFWWVKAVSTQNPIACVMDYWIPILVDVTKVFGGFITLIVTSTATSNDRHGVWNYRFIECMFNILFKLITKKHQRPALLALCEGNPPIAGGFATQGTVTWKMFQFNDVMMPCLQIPSVARPQESPVQITKRDTIIKPGYS